MNPTKNQNEECAAKIEVGMRVRWREVENSHRVGGSSIDNLARSRGGFLTGSVDCCYDSHCCVIIDDNPGGIRYWNVSLSALRPLPAATQEKWEPRPDELCEGDQVCSGEIVRGEFRYTTTFRMPTGETIDTAVLRMSTPMSTHVRRHTLRPAQDAPVTSSNARHCDKCMDPAVNGGTLCREHVRSLGKPVVPERPSIPERGYTFACMCMGSKDPSTNDRCQYCERRRQFDEATIDRNTRLIAAVPKHKQVFNQLSRALPSPFRDKYGQLKTLRGWPEADESDP